ncbi:MAG: MFS transporter [Phycisphaerae bacterium]
MTDTKTNSTALKLILMVTFVDLIGFGLIIPLVPTYAERLNASGLTLGLLIGAYPFVQLVVTPLMGRWSDHVGRRTVLMLSMFGSFLSHILLGFADISASLSLLFVARILDGITGASIATAQAYIADVTTPENRAKGMGLFGAAFGLGFVLGPSIGAALSQAGEAFGPKEYATSWAAFGAAIIALIAFILVWLKLPESKPEVNKEAAASRRAFSLDDIRLTLGNVKLRQLIVVMFNCMVAFVMLEATFAYLCLRNLQADQKDVAWLFAYIGVLIVIVQGGLVGRLARRFGEARLICIGPFLTGAGMLLIASVPDFQSVSLAWWLLLLACIPIAGGNGLTNPNLTALISKQAPADRQGGTLGVAQGLGALARAIAPPIGGWLFDQSPSAPYLAGGTLFLVIGVYALTIRTGFLQVNESPIGEVPAAT